LIQTDLLEEVNNHIHDHLYPRIKLEEQPNYEFQYNATINTRDLNYANHLGNDSLVGILQDSRVAMFQKLGVGEAIVDGKKEILARIKELSVQGFNEIVLTGIHLSSYGLDLKPRSSLLEVLREITKVEGLPRIRLSSLDPRFLKPSLIELITKSEKICPHFHLSLQSGSDEILGRMGRRVKVETYTEILSSLREKSPCASLGADIIVGFPGETEEEFEHTCTFLRQSPLTYFHVFSYSARPGTAAASWQQVHDRVKKERSAILRKISRTKNTDFRRNFLGEECEAVLIKKGETQDEVLTSNYFRVCVPSSPYSEKDEMKVLITQVDEREARGKIVNQPHS